MNRESGLPGNTIYRLLEDVKNRSVWIGTQQGLCHYQNGHFTIMEHPEQADQEIMELFQDTLGVLVYSNLSGQVFSVINGQVTSVLSDPDFSASYIFFEHQFLWVLGRKQQAWELRVYALSARANTFRPLFSRTLPPTNCSGFRKLGKNHLLIAAKTIDKPWIFSTVSPLSKVSIDAETEKTANDFKPFFFQNLPWKDGWIYLDARQQLCYKNQALFHLPNTKVNQIKVINGIAHVLTQKGLYRIHSEESAHLSPALFPEWQINDVMEDRQGRLWVGTTQGLAIVPDLQAMLYQEQFGGLPDKQVLATATYGEGRVLCSTDDAFLLEVLLRGNTGRRFTSALGNIRQLIPATDPGHFWCIAENGLLLFDANSWKVKETLFKGGNIKTLYTDGKNTVAGTAYGMFRISKATDASIVTDRYTVPWRVYALLPWKQGLWLAGTEKGIWKVQLTEAPVAVSELISPLVQVNKMVKDRRGHIWVATTSQGLLHFNSDMRLINTPKEQQLYGLRILDLVLDTKGLLWILSEKGLYAVVPETERLLHFLPPNQYQVNTSTTIALQGSAIWLGGMNGLIAVPDISKIPSAYNEHIVIHKLYINNRPYTPASKNTLESHENNLFFTFAKSGLVSQEQGGFEYQLEGSGKEWRFIPTSDLQLYLPNPGKYQLKVRAATAPGILAANTLTFAFTIRTPWYLTWWFYATVIIGIAGISAMGVYYWQQLKNTALERERSLQGKMADLQQQALRAQLNPHFIFNALNSISQFISANEERQALHYLSRFSKLIRAVLEASRKKSILLEQELELLEHYLELERLRYQGDVDIRLEIQEEVQLQIHGIWVPPMLYQPIIENSLKHGLNNKSTGNKYLGISFSLESPYLVCAIEDNGVGREAASRLAKWNATSHQSSGLTMTHERLSALGQSDVTTTHQPVMITQDLKDAEGHPTGTRTIIKIVI